MDRIDVMRLFVRIVERESFAQASRDLQIPRPTATHAIQRLEARIGVRLLERTTRSVKPTLDGLLYHDRCIQILADLDEMDSVFRDPVPRGSLRVDMQGTLARFFVLPMLPQFISRYPDIALNLSEGDRMVDLVAEGVDCVLRAGDLPSSSLVGKRIARFDQWTLASPTYLDRHGMPGSPDDLDNHRMVAYAASATGKPYPLEFATAERQWEVMLPYDVVVRGAEIYTASALAGLGIIQVPRYRVQQQVAAGELVPLFEDVPPPTMDVSILYPQSRNVPSRVRVFIDWLTSVFQNSQY